MSITISKDQARNFLIRRQHYRAYGSSYVGQNGVGEAIRHLGAVQIDPINAFERNHHHVLFCRVGGYRPVMLDLELYQRKRSFEYYCNALCVIPMEEYPYFHYRMEQRRRDYTVSPTVRQVAEELISHLRESGEAASRDFNSGVKVSGWWDSKEEVTKVEKHALDYLHLTGQVMISRRDGIQRVYDIPERIVPPEYLDVDIDNRQWREFMLDKFLRAYGLSQTGLFRFGWFDAPKAEKKDLLKRFVAEGRAEEIQVEGIKRPYYCHIDNLADLLNNSPLASMGQAVLVAPLDNLLWDRDVISDIFGFEYRWEVYTPPAKRVYGYYVLPVLYEDRFVGRIELKASTENQVLSIVNQWLDEDTPQVRLATRQTVEEIAHYLGLGL